jgi:HIRAN domain
MDLAFDLWGQRGRPGVDVVGESHYADAVREVFGIGFRPGGCELMATAQLVPEPWNRHDPDAVAVWVGERQVGYLPRHEAGRYAPVLARLVAEGRTPQVLARLWAASDYRGRPGLTGSVRIDLAEPHLIAPVNREPGRPYRLLPPGAPMQVTGEEGHLGALVPRLGPEGENWAYVTLHELVEPLTRGSRSVLEVRLDGAPVGQLTPRMSAELLPAVRHLASNNELTAARALVKGPTPEVLLYVPRAHELPTSWLGTAGLHTGASSDPADRSPAIWASGNGNPRDPSPANMSLTNASPTNASPTNASPTNASPTNARLAAAHGSAGVPSRPGHWNRIDAGNSAAVPMARSAVLNNSTPSNGRPHNHPNPHPDPASGTRPPDGTGPAGGQTPDGTGVPDRTATGHVAPPVRAAARVSVPPQTGPPTGPPATARPGQHGPIPPPPAGVRFAVPPGWPQPPAGWTPSTGWRPDPHWPPAPPEWQWWVPYWD